MRLTRPQGELKYSFSVWIWFNFLTLGPTVQLPEDAPHCSPVYSCLPGLNFIYQQWKQFCGLAFLFHLDVASLLQGVDVAAIPKDHLDVFPTQQYLYLDFNLLRITSPASNLSKIPRVEFMTLKLFSNWTIRSKTLERKKKLTGISGFSFSLNWDTCNKEGDPCSNTGSLSTSFVKGVNLCFMKSKFKPIFTYMTSLLYEWVTPMKFNYIKILDIV